MTSAPDSPLPNDVATLQTMLLTERAARFAAESEAKFRALLIEQMKFTIAKLRHERFGQSSERGAVLEQLELQLADMEEDASEAAAAAQMAAARAKVEVRSFERRKPARRPLPEHLPRERIVYPVPAACPCCGGGTLRKIGEDVTETLELIPRQWKVIQCQSAFKFDPVSASNFDPLVRRALAVALAPSELVGVAETARARVIV